MDCRKVDAIGSVDRCHDGKSGIDAFNTTGREVWCRRRTKFARAPRRQLDVLPVSGALHHALAVLVERHHQRGDAADYGDIERHGRAFAPAQRAEHHVDHGPRQRRSGDGGTPHERGGAFREHAEEADALLQEGLRIQWLTTIKKVIGSDLTVEIMELDASGRPRPTGRFETLTADAIVLALGQDPDSAFLRQVPNIEFSADGVVKVGPDMMTGHPGIFAGGDLVGGERSVTHSVGHGKRAALLELRQELGLAKEETMAIGDGANDLDMIVEAGLGVAYHAKPKVAEAAAARIDHGDLTALLYVQGYRRDEFVES